MIDRESRHLTSDVDGGAVVPARGKGSCFFGNQTCV